MTIPLPFTCWAIIFVFHFCCCTVSLFSVTGAREGSCEFRWITGATPRAYFDLGRFDRRVVGQREFWSRNKVESSTILLDAPCSRIRLASQDDAHRRERVDRDWRSSLWYLAYCGKALVALIIDQAVWSQWPPFNWIPLLQKGAQRRLKWLSLTAL